jgi:hypothetical protein
MPKSTPRAAAKRGRNAVRKVPRASPPAADFCALAKAALKRGKPDDIPDRLLQRVLSAAVKIYAAKTERRGHDVKPFEEGAITATETVVAACGMIRAADLNMFDVAIWFHRPPGID